MGLRITTQSGRVILKKKTHCLDVVLVLFLYGNGLQIRAIGCDSGVYLLLVVFVFINFMVSSRSSSLLQ